MEEGELALDLDVGAALDAAALRPQQHVLEVELHLVDHVRHLASAGCCGDFDGLLQTMNKCSKDD